MKRTASYVIGLAQIATVFTVVQFDKVSGLNQNWLTNRTLIESRVHLNQTGIVQGVPTFFKAAYDSNLTEIGKFSGQVQCATGKDVSKCRTGAVQ
jgi:hypothetical protein